jgi:threonine aldolase
MKGPIIDLRSDTVTQPTPQMRLAMSRAEVGDDVYGEDPTVNQLQQKAAEIFEREAALLVPSGTMANQIAIRIYTRAGQEVICEERAHIFNSELGMMAAFTGCLVRPIWAQDGILTWTLIEPYLRRVGTKYGSTGLIALENTSNFAGGTIYPLNVAKEICDRAHEVGIPVFLDGARIFNAAVRLGIPVAEIGRKFDSLMFSLSKGLGAPVGSVLVGSADFIEEARHIRKMLGGAMRQAGILAAAGLLALKDGPSHLHVDHENAKFIASGLAELPCLRIDAEKVTTNIVLMETTGTCLSSPDLVIGLAAQGVLANAIGPDTLRLVTHRDVSRTDCEQALRIIRQILRAPATTTGRRRAP